MQRAVYSHGIGNVSEFEKSCNLKVSELETFRNWKSPVVLKV